MEVRPIEEYAFTMPPVGRDIEDDRPATRGFKQAFAEEVGTSIGRAMGLGLTATVSGLLAYARRDDFGVIALVALLLALAAAGLLLANVLRTRLTKLVARQRADLQRLQSRVAGLDERLRNERERSARFHMQAERQGARERQLRNVAEGLESHLRTVTAREADAREALSCVEEYRQIRLEMLTTVADQCGNANQRPNRDRILDGVLSTARSALSQVRGARTRLAVVETTNGRRQVTRTAGIPAHSLEDISRTLVDLTATLADSSLVVEFGSGSRDSLVVLADGDLSPKDCEFAHEAAAIFALADVALASTERHGVSPRSEGAV
jgi:hypothetical protein